MHDVSTANKITMERLKWWIHVPTNGAYGGRGCLGH